MFPLLLLIPIALSLAAVLLSRNSMGLRYVAVGGSIASFALLYFVSYGTVTIPWFTAGSFAFNITTTIAPLNLALLGTVLFIGSLVMVYSSGFMSTLSEQRRFYAEMLAFEISMCAFAMSGNFVLLFISWEFMSLTSYLLIGFWHGRERAVRSSRLAVTIVLMGDIALLAAIAVFLNLFGTLSFSGILAALPAHASPQLYLGALLLVVAVLTKSAQFPFQEWLPDAMEGPTPVSAFLHSTTMVKAGVFLAIILYPLLYRAGVTPVIMTFAVVTAAISTVSAMRSRHVKRVIAYSTIQELSLMLVAVSGGALFAAIYFFLVQSLYKALLFFSAGSIMKATDEEGLDRISGLGINKVLYISTLIGVLSLAGFFPLSGFFAAASTGGAFSQNLVIYAIISLIGLATSFYIFRWFLLVSKPASAEATALRYLGQPRSMLFPIVILACLTAFASVFVVFLNSFLAGGYGWSTYLASGMPISISLQDGIIVMALALVGAAASYLVYKRRSRAPAQGKSVSLAAAHRRGAFALLYILSASFLYDLGEGVALFESYLNGMFDYLGHLLVLSASRLRRMSVGAINPYAFIFAVSAILLLAYALLVI